MSATQHSLAGKVDKKDLLIVGPGVLGSYVGKQWLELYPQAKVVGQTNTNNNHERLKKLGITPRLKTEADDSSFPFVLFSAPPSGSQDYAAEVAAALSHWDGSGTFLFTSSAGLYAEDSGGLTTEHSPLAPPGNERQDRLRGAEETCLSGGGCVVRLVGLYHANRGAHTFFLKQGEVSRWGGTTVNLIHYEDAGQLSIAILRGDGADGYYRSSVFLGADSNPVSFQDMMDSTLSSGAFEGSVKFTGSANGSKGKVVDNQYTRDTLMWQPKYSSFADFMKSGAKDFFVSSGMY